jgi:hypothetical protein
MKDMFNFIWVLNTPQKHCFDSSGWNMVECMNNVVLQSTRMAMQDAQFVVVSCDKVTNINCQSWVKMHVFVVKAWKWILILLSLSQVVNDASTNNLAKLIVVPCCNVLGFLSQIWGRS